VALGLLVSVSGDCEGVAVGWVELAEFVALGLLVSVFSVKGFEQQEELAPQQ
jgi:hypothetical protein